MSKAAFGKAAAIPDKVQHIKLAMIDRNEGNFYSIEGIEELADSIRTVGLMDPVRVVPIEGGKGQRYKLISGHRRLEAYWHLLRECAAGNWETIPALVMEDMDDLTETFALITANSTARELTYAEKLKQEQLLRETLTAMRDAGKPVPKNLGQYIADQIGTSRNEVSRMHSINENLIPEAREQVDKGEMTAQRAYELSRKPEQEQRETVEQKKRVSIYDEKTPDEATMLAAVRDSLLGLIEQMKMPVLSRSDGITEMKNELYSHYGRGRTYRIGGMWGNPRPAIYKEAYHIGHIKPSDLWDLMGVVAIERLRADLSKLDTEDEDDDAAATPAASIWHEEDPTEVREYLCMYNVIDGGRDPGYVVMDWTGSEWRKYGSSVKDVYKILKWTEVPE